MMKNSLLILSLLFSVNLHAAEASAPVDSDAVSEVQAGKEIYEKFCADTCHQIPVPSRLKPKQWRIVLNTMQTRMKSANMTPLTEEQSRQILEYLSQAR